MFAAVKVYQDFNHRYPPSVDQYGLRFVSEELDPCINYAKEHRDEFLEMNGNYHAAVVSFDPKDFPMTMEHLRTSPNLHICFHTEAELMASKVVVGRI